MRNRLFSLLGLGAVATATLVGVAAVNLTGNQFRVDLTEQKLFTLAPGTENILGHLNNEIELEFYFSNQMTKTIPELRNYAKRVDDLLAEFVLASNGKLKLTRIDPAPFTEAEDAAALAGLQAVPVSLGGDQIYFGLVGKNQKAVREETIAFFHPNREAFLEYELAQMIDRLNHPQEPNIAVLSGLKIQGGSDMMGGPPAEPWIFLNQLARSYEIKNLEPSLDQIPAEVDKLLLVHPANLSDTALYAIDQFVMRGGKLIVFLDPFAESATQSGFFPGMAEPRTSDLSKLMNAWGLEMAPGKFIGDMKHALSVNMGDGARPRRHLALLGMDSSSWIAKDSIVLNQLERINFSTAGALSAVKGASTSFEPLIVSSTQSALIDIEKLQHIQAIEDLFADFSPTGQAYVLAGLLTGQANSAFPDGYVAPAKVETPATPDAAAPTTTAESTATPATVAPPVESKTVEANKNHLAKSKGSIGVLVVADTDMLTDRLWVRVQDFFGQQVVQPWANNVDFVINGVDYFSGSADLISIRSRGNYTRPFHVVQQLRDQAEASSRAKETELKHKLAETENKLTELQQPPQNGVVNLSTEQQQALFEFQSQKLKIRKELRDVQRKLDSAIDNLGVQLKAANMFAVPVLLTVIALLSWLRKKRKR